jgi:hypothetical protein
MADHSVFSTADRTPLVQTDTYLSTLHAPEAAAEVVGECVSGQIDIVGPASPVDTATSAWQFVERPLLGRKAVVRTQTASRDG